MSCPAVAARRGPQPAVPPKVLARPTRPPAARQTPRPGANNQGHLAQWMERHSNLSVAEQQRALENEPGFHDLPAQNQQQLRDRLAQLNNMTPQQRSQMLERNELLESRTPQQRAQFRSGMEQFNALPQSRKLLFKKAFRDLREMPPAQRDTVIDSAPFRSQFSDPERSALKNVLAVEPYPPLKASSETSQPAP